MNEAPDKQKQRTDERTVVCPPFEPRRLERQIVRDEAVRWSAIAALGFCVMAGMVAETIGGESWYVTAIILLMPGWLMMSAVSARAAKQAQELSNLLEQDRPAAESILARTLRRWPLQPSVRLLLYHRLATLRHRQGRFAEAAVICQTVLAQRLRRARHARSHMLLILAESRLMCGDWMGTYGALHVLHQSRLSLTEVLQLLAIQIRYEVTSGQDQAALFRISRKIPLVELMPMPQCGAVHALLAQSAERAQNETLATWLRERADLLCSSTELEHYFADQPMFPRMV